MTQIDQYHLTLQIGSGKNGASWQALDTASQRVVALKLLDSSAANWEEQASLLQTVSDRLHARPSKQNVSFVSIGQTDDSFYLVREYIDGLTIFPYWQNAATPVAKTLSLAEQIASGLADAHAVGVIHGNLGLSNLIISPNDEVRLVDFALPTPLRLELLSPVEVAHLAPELLAGAPASEQSDLFAAGIALYVLLTGHLPHPHTATHDYLQAMVSRSLHLKDPRLDALDGDVRLLLKKMTDPDPADRFATANECAVTISEIRKEQSRPKPVHRPAKRVWSARAYLYVALLMLGLIFIWLFEQWYFRQ